MKPSEQGAQNLHILTAARGHLAGSQERGPRKIPARGLAEGDAPALGRQPLTQLLPPLGSHPAADRALEWEEGHRVKCSGSQRTQPTTEVTVVDVCAPRHSALSLLSSCKSLPTRASHHSCSSTESGLSPHVTSVQPVFCVFPFPLASPTGVFVSLTCRDLFFLTVHADVFQELNVGRGREEKSRVMTVLERDRECDRGRWEGDEEVGGPCVSPGCGRVLGGELGTWSETG